ncbi:unnamed protein product [Clonostachys rhizophaga]|uniref:AB hydrolase-1 domain-containing protein n=1 Tax=Clonostachys rhizophaga TaxID=160324 RepID=A0A9N9YW54_9HYPO|nr:unnamed protein product [Clonostachys rhizophaga]
MSQTKPVIAIVPGGFCSPDVYAKVADILQNDGFEAIVPRLKVTESLPSKDPTTKEFKDLANKDLPDDVQAILADLTPLLDQGRKALIVGHSYGSLPALLTTQGQTVEERSAKGLPGGIKAYAVVAGFAYGTRGRNVRGNLEDAPALSYFVHEEGIFHIQPAAKPLFFSDLPSEEQDSAWTSVLGSQSRKSLGYVSEFITTDLRVPKTYILCEKDEVVPPAVQERFAAMGKFDQVEMLPTGHFPFLSSPEKTAELLNLIATR